MESKHHQAQSEYLLEKTEVSISSESQEERDQNVRNDRRRRHICHIIGPILSLVTFITVTLIILKPYRHNYLSNTIITDSPIDHAAHPNIAQCGSSFAEAISKGCIFDPLAAGYIPPACYDHDLFLAAQREATINLLSWELNRPFQPYPTPETFEWYTDRSLTISIAQDDIPKTMPFKAYTWGRFRITHCEYLATSVLNAARRIQAGERNVYVDSRALDETHMEHCRYVLGEQIRRIGEVALVDFGYGNCTKLV